jgi:hypothetical protein
MIVAVDLCLSIQINENNLFVLVCPLDYREQQH